MSKRSDPDLEYVTGCRSRKIHTASDWIRIHNTVCRPLMCRAYRGESILFVYQNISGIMSNKLSCLRFVCICVAASAVLTFFLNAASISDIGLPRLQKKPIPGVFNYVTIKECF